MCDSGSASAEWEAVVSLLGLTPHPEGGFFRETFRSDASVDAHGGHRAASTAIYFLLHARAFSAWHRVRSDEVWHHYAGDPLELHVIDAAGAHRVVVLGRDLSGGQRPQHVVPAGVWQAAVPAVDRGGLGHALVGCTVAPGFDFADFEMPSRADLAGRFPQHAAIIERLTRADSVPGSAPVDSDERRLDEIPK